MKILHIEAGRHYYGGARQVIWIMEGLAKRGHQNILACPEQSHIAGQAHTSAQVCEIPMGGDLDWRLKGRLRALIREHSPDIVHVHSRRGADVWGPKAARAEGVPCVISRRVDNRENGFWARRKYNRVAHVITISDGIRQVLLSEGVRPEQVTCVRSAVDPEPYQRIAEKSWFRKEMGLIGQPYVAGVVAQLIPRKGHRLLLDVLPEILKLHPDLQVLLFGRGPMEEELARVIEESGLGPHVRLVGFRDDLPRMLCNLDLLIHPASMEGLGVSLLQASAARVPIIASAVGGIPEAVKDEYNGLLVPPNNDRALARAMHKLLNDRPYGRWLGNNGPEHVQAHFSIDGMIDGNVRVYEQVLRQKR